MKKPIITKAELAHLFATYPEVNTFYITADGNSFKSPDVADGHAQRLPIKTTITVTRDEFESGEAKSFADGLASFPVAVGDDHMNALFAAFLKLERDNEPVVIKTSTQQFLEAIQDRIATKELFAAMGTIVLVNDELPLTDEQIEELATALKSGGAHLLAAPIVASIEPQAAPTAPATAIAPVVVAPVELTKEEKAAQRLKEAYDTPAEKRTGYQKGLVTAAEKAKIAAEGSNS